MSRGLASQNGVQLVFGFNEIQTLLRRERGIFSYEKFQLLSEETGHLGFHRREVCKQELD